VSILHLDWESRSTIDLRKTGVYRYAQHEDTDLWCGAWAFDDEEPDVWFPGQRVPQRIVDHVEAGGIIRAWNAAFERIMWKYIAGPRYHWPEAQLEQFVCSAAEAAAMNLPRALGMAAAVTKIETQKDDAGYRLMLQMCRPRKIHADGTIEWWNLPEKITRLADYCKQDVRTEGRLDKALLRLTPLERQIYLLDQRINDRGVHIDRPLVEAAMELSKEGILRANAELQSITEGAVQKVSNTGKLREWLCANGVQTDSVDKATLVELLEGKLEDKVRQALELRQEAGRSSLKKLDAMLDVACDDNLARGLLLYHAAGTGRWGGRLIQPQNFPRGTVKNVEQFIDAVLAGDYEYIDLFAHPLIVLSALLRAMITARPGHELIAADYSAIEARVANWLAGQDDVCESFRQYDAAPTKAEKMKFDPYRIMAVKMGRGTKPEEISDKDRQAGKAAELGCGFGMGADKFISAAWDVYQVRVAPEESKPTVDTYRATHPMVKKYWRDVEDAAIAAVASPGTVHKVGPLQNVKYVRSGGWLYCILPSGRPLLYAQPKLVERAVPWCEHCGKREQQHLTGVGANYINHSFVAAKKLSLEYSACDEQTGKWNRYSTYGGHLFENIVQAVARDLLAEGLLRAEQRGYPPVLSVHDEGVCEVPLGQGSVKELESIMSELPEWATGCPVAAEGWKGLRYRK
jgi:DNA polymerase